MGLYLVLPDLNQLGLKVDKNLEFSISAKNKDNQDFYFWLDQRAVFDRQKSVNMVRLILVDLIDTV